MSRADERRDALTLLSRALGREERGLAILGEGNTSVDNGDGTFWVKASGASLGTLDASGVTRVRHDAIVALLERGELDEPQVEAGLMDARVDARHRRPSVETFLHALCLREEGVGWVAHTHTVSINRILCSALGAEPFRHHVFPDAVVVCGVAPAVVAYADPGLALARAVAAELARYRDAHGHPPKLLLMENHGPVALGASAREVENIMLMADKWARILWGSYALGGPRFLPHGEAEHIDARLDEAVRRRALLAAGEPDG